MLACASLRAVTSPLHRPTLTLAPAAPALPLQDPKFACVQHSGKWAAAASARAPAWPAGSGCYFKQPFMQYCKRVRGGPGVLWLGWLGVGACVFVEVGEARWQISGLGLRRNKLSVPPCIAAVRRHRNKVPGGLVHRQPLGGCQRAVQPQLQGVSQCAGAGRSASDANSLQAVWLTLLLLLLPAHLLAGCTG